MIKKKYLVLLNNFVIFLYKKKITTTKKSPNLASFLLLKVLIFSSENWNDHAHSSPRIYSAAV